MSLVNPKVQDRAVQGHANWMDGRSFDISNPITKLRIAASSCFFGEPMYYHRDPKDYRPQPVLLSKQQVEYLRTTLDSTSPAEWRGLSPTQLMERAIDQALDADPAATLALAVELRNEAFIRLTPQVILVRAANHPKVKGTPLIGLYGPQIVMRGDEPANGLAYQLAVFGKPIPNSLKRVWNKVLSGFNEYQLAKYKQSEHAVALVDVVNLVHANSDAIDKLMKGTLKLNGATWESMVSEQGSNPQAWAAAIPLMGHMALLRNLRNLFLHKVLTPNTMLRLIDGVAEGKQLPFRYYSAFIELRSAGAPAYVLDGIERALKASLANLPKFSGRVMSLCDNSGSAHGTMTSSMGSMTVAQIANLTAVLTGALADEGHVGIFGDRLETVQVRNTASILDQVAKVTDIGASIGGGTENGIWLFFDQAIKQREHWDHIFVYSDMQAGHGGLYGLKAQHYADYAWFDGRHIDVAKLIRTYREQVNPKVQVYLVQMAGYQDTLVPEFYRKTYVLGGWGPGVLRFAQEMSRLDQ